MTEPRPCPKCGAELPADAPEGLCPKCLLEQGMETQRRPEDAGEAAATPSGAFIPPRPEELAPLFPQLEITELLGHGGMGAVYKARQPRLDRLVALKIIRPEGQKDPVFAERFAREARALARLSHPNIVAVHDFGQAGELYYFIMEYVDGASLRQMERAERLSPAQALAVVPQICDALHYAHGEGVVHRDIKPENILVHKKGRVKIADFGLAKLLGHGPADFTLTGSQTVLGTPHYMAPEQIERPAEVDQRADIYSLGVVLYEMLTGELPLGRFAPPSQKVQVDVRLDEVVLKALEKEPGRRYQHASEVKTDVEEISRMPGAPAPSAGRVAAPADDLERLILELLPYRKVAAVGVYRDKTGAGLAEAKEAVEAIARKRGIQDAPVSGRQHWRAMMVAGAIMAGIVLGTILISGLVDLSPVIWGAFLWAFFVPFLVVPSVRDAWRYRGTTHGRRAALLAGGFLFFLVGIPVLSFLGEPEPTLNWLYRVTGAKPGRHDVAFVQGLGFAAVLGTLVWLIWLLRKLRRQHISQFKAEAEAAARQAPPPPAPPGGYAEAFFRYFMAPKPGYAKQVGIPCLVCTGVALLGMLVPLALEALCGPGPGNVYPLIETISEFLLIATPFVLLPFLSVVHAFRTRGRRMTTAAWVMAAVIVMPFAGLGAMIAVPLLLSRPQPDLPFRLTETLSKDGNVVAITEKASADGRAAFAATRYPLDSLEGVITKSGVELDKAVSSDGGGSLKIVATGPTVVRLFETGPLDVDNARLIYQAKLRTEGVEGSVYLEMWCRFPGLGESFSRGLDRPLSGTTDWATAETPFFLKEGQKPDNVRLNLVINGKGTVWIDDIHLLKGPLK